MMYLFDTDTLSNLLKRTPSTVLIARLATIPPGDQCTSSITLGELLYGAARLGGDRTSTLRGRIEELLIPNLPVIPFDVRAARQYATLRADLERLGAPLAEADLRIASIALAHGLILVTENVRYFDRVPHLTVENWLG